MKWGRKKSALPSSSSPISAITRVFPVSWFSKSKQRGGSFQSKSKQSCAFEFPTPKSSGWREGRFYSMDGDDSFWRLSFGDERIQGRRSTGGINPLWYDSDHDFEALVSGFRSFESTEMEVSRREEYRNFSEMVSDIKKTKESRGKQRIVAENGGKAGKTGDGKAGVSTRRRKDMDDQISRKSRGFDDGKAKISNSGERDIFPIEPETMVSIKDDSRKSPVSKSRKHHKNPIFDQNPVSEWLDFEGRKLKEIKIKTESKKKAANANRGIKSYSPRTDCKIRALEEMKKARTKAKKKERKERVLGGSTIFDSFAVVKSSYNPQQDFRESMTEMIREKGIDHPGDLEELLACYLTLNCDEYHDLIIKVFRQVWFELKGVYIDPPIKNGAYFDY